MAGDLLLNRLFRPLARSKREKLLLQAAQWPVYEAKVLRAKIVPADPLTEASGYQESQLECPFYLTVGENYLSGYLRSVPMSFSEANRTISKVKEDTVIRVRCNPQNPDETHTLTADNQGALPFEVWSS